MVGWGFLSDYIEDQQRPGLDRDQGGGPQYTVRDVTRRAQMYVDQNGGTEQRLRRRPHGRRRHSIEEALLLKYASEKDVRGHGRRDQVADRHNSRHHRRDPNFDARYKEELAATGISEAQYRDLSEADVLKEKLTEVFKAEVPDTLPTPSTTSRSRSPTRLRRTTLSAQLNAGADFATLYAEHQTGFTEEDTTGGDKGFVPEGYLDEALEDVLFSLDPNEITTYPDPERGLRLPGDREV